MIETNIQVSIAICTFNREFFLEKCLNSIFKYTKQSKLFDIIVIDNNSSDNTKDVVLKFQKENYNLRYFKEKNIGLSYARNRAIKETKTPYIAFIDDDVKISKTYLDRLIWLISNCEFDCIGGMYYPWYISEKPKWISNDFGQKEMLLDSIGILKSEYNSGGNIMFKTDILKKHGGFPIHLGMKGNKISYGEEDYVQSLIRKDGGKIYFDPELIVFHVVQKYKISLIWQLKSIYINSKTNFTIHKEAKKISNLIFQLFKSIFATILLRLPIGLYRLFVKKGFYYQNLILYLLKPVLINLGSINSYFQSKDQE